MKSRLLLLLAALLWSTSGAAIKLTTLNGPQVAAGRSFFAALALLVLSRGARSWPTWRSAGIGLSYALTVGLFAMANKLTTAANSIFLQDAAPLYVMVLSTFWLKERPTRGELLAAPVFLTGLGLFFLDQLGPGQAQGNALAIGAGVAFGLTIVLLRRYPEEGARSLLVGNLIAAVLFAPGAVGGPVPTPSDWGLLVFLGVVQLALPYLAFAKAVRVVPATEASLLVLLEPVLNPAWAFLIAGERPGPWAMVGGAVILGATIWRVLAARAAQMRPRGPAGSTS